MTGCVHHRFSRCASALVALVMLCQKLKRLWQLVCLSGLLIFSPAFAQDAPPSEPLLLKLETATLERVSSLLEFTGTRLAPGQAVSDELAAPVAISLPHRWGAEELGKQTSARNRYRLNFRLEAPGDRELAVYIPKLSLSGEIRLNGRLAGACAPASLEVSRCLHQPQLFVPPADYWLPGTNQLEITVFGNDRQPNGLSAVWVGDLDSIRPMFQQRHFWQVEALHILTVSLLALSLLALAMQWLTPHGLPERRTLLLLGLAGIVNALCDLNMLITVPPVDFELYSWFTFVARLESMPMYVLTLLSFYGRLPRWLMRGTLVGMVLMAAAVWWSGNSAALVRWMYVPLGLLATGAFSYSLHITWQEPRRRHMAMVLVSIVLLSAGWWDFAKVQGALAFERIYLLPYAYPATLLAMGWLMLSWLGQAMAAQQQLSLSLEQQLAERQAALHQALEREQEAERRRIREEERVGLLSHMHDGLGSQLVSARLALTHGEIDVARAADILAECTDDLRLVLNTLRPDTPSLPNAVADLRHRLQGRLAQAPVKLEWQVHLDGLPALTASQILQWMRILQEAITNALRHAQASHVQVRFTWHASEGLELVVEDDGTGMPGSGTGELETSDRQAIHSAATKGSGLGLVHLRQRARSLGASLAITDRPLATELAESGVPAHPATTESTASQSALTSTSPFNAAGGSGTRIAINWRPAASASDETAFNQSAT